MSDYTKLEDAVETLADYFNSLIDFHGYDTIQKNTIIECIKRIKSIPSADVVERKVGHWEGGDYPYMTEITPLGRNEHYWYSCSICKCGQGYKTPYCPNCGARMEES